MPELANLNALNKQKPQLYRKISNNYFKDNTNSL